MKDDIEAPRFTAGHWFHGGKNLVIKSTGEPLTVPPLPPRRIKGVIAEVCSVCSYPLDSDQHVNHYRR